MWCAGQDWHFWPIALLDDHPLIDVLEPGRLDADRADLAPTSHRAILGDVGLIRDVRVDVPGSSSE